MVIKKSKYRHSFILENIEKEKSISIADLSKQLNTSEATIRRDLKEISKNGWTGRVCGGVVLSGSIFSYESRISRNIEEKERIAKKAIEYISSGDILMLDIGTTNLELVRMLKQDSELKDITIITNGLDIALELEDAKEVKVIVIGGILRKGNHCTGNKTSDFIRQSFHVKKVFIGAAGLTAKAGVTKFDMESAEDSYAMASAAEKKFVLCDYSKIGVTAFITSISIEDIDVLITDDKADKNNLIEIAKEGVEVIVV
jgi:Transcriptional regulators of sugar metabolism